MVACCALKIAMEGKVNMGNGKESLQVWRICDLIAKAGALVTLHLMHGVIVTLPQVLEVGQIST